jgi:hypothetical protein
MTTTTVPPAPPPALFACPRCHQRNRVATHVASTEAEPPKRGDPAPAPVPLRPCTFCGFRGIPSSVNAPEVAVTPPPAPARGELAPNPVAT